MTSSLAHALHAALAHEPDKTALLLIGPDGEQSTTRCEVNAHARYTAQQLIANGVQPGDVLLILLDHCYEAVPMFLGALYMGAVPMILPYVTAQTTPAQQAERLTGLVRFFQPKALLTRTRLHSEIDALSLPVHTFAWDFHAVDVAAPPEVMLSTRGGEELAYLQFTSGTTGQPKAVMISHRALLNAFEHGAERFQLTSDDLCVLAAPLSHASGLAGACLHMLWLGIRSVIISPGYWAQNPAILLRAIHEYRGTYSITTNTGLNLTMLRVPPESVADADLSSLRLLVVGSEMVAPATLQAFAHCYAGLGFNASAFTIAYAASEVYIAFQRVDEQWRAESISATALVNDKLATLVAPDAPDARLIACCGVPLRGVTVQVRDDAGHVLPDRHLGQIVVQADSTFSGYWHNPELTAAVLRDGWYHTGDLGYLVDGALFVVGRLKDLIIVGGRNVLPDAIEEQAFIAGRGMLRGAVAFGVRDPVIGTEQPVLVCEMAAPLDDVARDQAAQTIRERVRQLLDVALLDLCFVEAGWIVRAGGKLARSANREKYLAERRPAPATQPASANHSVTEQVTHIFEDLLGRHPIGLDDNFFDLGGDSITALKMLLRVEQELGRSVPPHFFQQPTVNHLVSLLAGERVSVDDAEAEPPPLPLPAASHTKPAGWTPQRIRSGARRRFENRAFRRPYLNGMRWLADWCGSRNVQQMFYPQEVQLFRAFWADVHGATPVDPAELQRNLIGNILLQRLFKYMRNTSATEFTQALQSASTPLLRELGDALAAPESELGQRIITVEGEEHLQRLRPGQGSVVISYHATTRLVGMGPFLKRQTEQFWLGAPIYRTLATTRFGATFETSEEHVKLAVRTQATQTAANVLRSGGIVGLAVDEIDPRNPTPIESERLPFYTTGFAELALATGAAVIPTYTVLHLDGRLTQHILPALDMGDASLSHAAQVAHLSQQAGAFLDHIWRNAPSTLEWRAIQRLMLRASEKHSRA